MSFDVFCQRFRGGDAYEADAEVIRHVLAPYFTQVDEQIGFAQLRLPDGEADVTAWMTSRRGS